MKTLGNIIWFLLVGLWSGLGYFFGGLLLCITIVGIPFGLQLFKMARLMLWPFGATVVCDFNKHPFANLFWLLFGGLFTAFWFFIIGVIFCITIVGIPFGKQCLKLSKLTLAPFGSTIS
nr:hypothetical protein [Clostridia bacterium]